MALPDPKSVVASGIPAIADLLGRFIDVGFSKFVLVPVFPPTDIRAELERRGAADFNER